MVAVTAIVREGSTVANISDQEMAGLKMKVSPALSFVSTVALSEAAEMWDFSDDDDDDDASVEPPWSALAPVLGSLEANETVWPNSAGSDKWGDVGAKLAGVMREAIASNDLEETPLSESVHGADEQAWHLVGLRLGRLFSRFDNDGESTSATANPNESALDVLGINIKDTHKAHSASHQRWHAVGSGIAAVLNAAET